MDNLIIITNLNDFIFCPASIYFHNLYGSLDPIIYNSNKQIDGKNAHESVDKNKYSTKKNILTGISVYSEKYGLTGKIDIFDSEQGLLTERKKKIVNIYDGYIFQLYAQYFCMKEMGYDVKKLRFHSIDDNKNYEVNLPENDVVMFGKFENIIEQMRTFELSKFKQNNISKCRNCIYEPACDRSLI
ncbi:type V CRISPR-associated protein Cas4 [Peptostreptococcus equinus]|uniref:Type V CRISPR-associated protein Cas4 n=1 Tax=Peptostreptococcus equinus TaxID=3003601 RepID=A0ABY7JN50_9FIRM|nr:type V CRISPR-associated protein Cas4 [Peptostreptococcus sp. CBA3647]WAW14525.1 type V CRISPR-associated protein Cas4 [Peptostreptococcus sp. CBA3647]